MRFHPVNAAIFSVLAAGASASVGSLRGDDAAGVSASASSSSRRALLLLDGTVGRVLEEEIRGTFLLSVHDDENGNSEEFLNVELEDGIFRLDGVPPGFARSVNPKSSGVGKIKIPPGSVKSGSRIDLRNKDPTIVVLSKPFDRRRLVQTTGPKSVLVVRVVANDASTTASEATLRDKWFGEGTDPVNLASQYAACSHDQLIVNGDSVTATIDINAIGANDGNIRNAVTSSPEVANIQENYDHIALCLPPGTRGSWIGYAYILGKISVYNNQWCNYVSIQMHEIGHNLNLAHSGETNCSYEDQTGMMGFSYSRDDGPVMCFNNAKNWQIGWFEDAKLTVGVDSAWTGDVNGQVNYAVGDLSQNPVVVEVLGGTRLYVGFNHRVRHNGGTVEAGNMVTVQTYSGDGYGESKLVAKLGAGESYSVRTLEVTVNSIDAGDAGFANVSIRNGDVASPTPPPTPAPTPSPGTCEAIDGRIACKSVSGCVWSSGSKSCSSGGGGGDDCGGACNGCVRSACDIDPVCMWVGKNVKECQEK